MEFERMCQTNVPSTQSSICGSHTHKVTTYFVCAPLHFCALMSWKKRDSANAVPTNRNYTTELPTFGVIAEVNFSEVQW